MKRLYHYILCGIIIAMMPALYACNESLEDTYKDYAGDGEIRYLGACTDLTASPGWERILVNWTNNVDPVIQKMKVTWKMDNGTDSILLDKGTTSYSIDKLNGKALEDGTYEITVYSVDDKGTCSLGRTVYARPYTNGHEEVQSFNRVVSKIYLIGNRLALSFLPWKEGMKSASVSYTRADGSAGQLTLTPELVSKGYYLVEDQVDSSKPVYVNRRSVLPGSIDEIDFEPYELVKTRTYNSELYEDLIRQYGYDEIPESWAASVETLYLDRNYSSFDDLMNFPNLKKLVLGGRRYIREEQVDAEEAQSSVEDVEGSLFALNTLHQLTGLQVERYNKHYPSLTADYIQEMGLAEEPSQNYISMQGVTVTSIPVDEGAFNSHMERLIDGDVNTFWEPLRSATSTDYTLTINLGTEKTLHGMRFVQRNFQNELETMVIPSTIQVKLSIDGTNWENAAYLEDVVLGNSNGEISHIPFTGNGRTALFVKIIVPPGTYFSTHFTSIAEIGLW